MTTDPVIPERLSKRPQYKGFVVPYTTLIDTNGVPDFKVVALDVWMQCAVEKLCGLCGEKLDYWVWWIGGDWQIEKEMFFDPPMHEECARYAIQVCPFIVHGKDYAKSLKQHEGFTVTDLAKRDFVERPKQMFLSKGRRDAIKIKAVEGSRHFLAVGTLRDTEEIPIIHAS